MPADNRERRVVTVLFSDLAGFTRMSESLDPEEIADTVDALFNRFRPLIEREGGTIDKFIGDAVMAVFGAPVAHRDDPARAVRAGLAMQRELTAFNAARGIDLRMRVGIATGEALWGSVAGARDSAMGDAVNVAQRMESSGAPGSVRVSRSTERAARGKFVFVAEGTVAVKGREAEVEAFAVEGEAAAVAPEGDSPMVGRADELARLTAALEPGRGRFFVLSGEAGTGKSRLAQEFRRVAEGREGMWVAAGRALEAVKLPLVAFGDIAGGDIAGSLATAIPDPVERENIAHLIVMSLGGSVPGARVANLDVARMADEMRQAWARWIGARSPAVLIVEDLHWADEATVTLLETLAIALAGRGTTIVATARPGARLPAGYAEIRLGELLPASIAALAESVLGAPPGGELLAFLTEKTAGHPYYLEELLRYLRDEHLVEGSPARLTSSLGPLPDSLTALLTAQLDALPAEARRVMKSASVVGRTFWLRLLERLVERESADAVEVARRRDIVISQDASLLPGDPQFSFRHALLKDAAYALLTRKERARLHGLAAGLLESRVSEGGRRIRALAARHREAAGQAAEAGVLWLAAAREAADARSSAEALEYAREAERLVPGPEAAFAVARALHGLSRNAEAVAAALRAEPGGGDLAAESRLLRSRAFAAMGQFVPAIEAARAAGATASGERLARALTLESQSLRLVGKLPESLDCAGAALAALESPESPPSPERDRIRVEALLALARTRRSAAAFPEAEAAAREALDLAVSRADAGGENAAWGALGDLHRAQGRNEESLRCYGRVLPWRLAMGDRRGVAVCRMTMGSALNTLGRNEEALVHYREALPILREAGDRYNAGWCLQGVALSIGKVDPSGAATFLDEAAQAFRESGSPSGLASVLNVASQIRFRLGDFPAARRLAVEAVEEFRRIGEKHSLIIALNSLGAALRAAGDLGDAAEVYREAISAPGAALDPRVRALSHEGLSEALEDAGDLAGAIREGETSLSLKNGTGDLQLLATSLGRLASITALAGGPAVAEALLRKRASILGIPESHTTTIHHACLRLCAGDPRGTARILEALGPPAPETRTIDVASYNFFLASVLSDLDLPADCRRTALAALGDGTSLTRAQSLGALLVIAQAELDEGLLPEAVARGREAVAAAATLGAPAHEAEARALLARALAFAGQGTEAEIESAKAIALAGRSARADTEVVVRAAAVASAEAGLVGARVRELETALARSGTCARVAARASLHAVDALRHAGHVSTAAALAGRASQRALEAGSPFWHDRLAQQATS